MRPLALTIREGPSYEIIVAHNSSGSTDTWIIRPPLTSFEIQLLSGPPVLPFTIGASLVVH